MCVFVHPGRTHKGKIGHQSMADLVHHEGSCMSQGHLVMWPTPSCALITSFFVVQEERVDETMDISQREAEGTMRALARVEGIFAGPSSGGAISAALRLSAKLENATIVAIVCDRGDRYLSTGESLS